MDEVQVCPATFAAFFDEHIEHVRGFAARKFGENDADDIAQETMLRAYLNLDRLTDGRPAAPWLYKVATNVGIDQIRRRRTDAVEADRLERLLSTSPDRCDEVAARVDVGGMLHHAMRRLTPKDRETLALHEVHGLGIDELATRSGATANAVRQRLFRARRNLGRHYRQLGGTEYSSVAAPRLRERLRLRVERYSGTAQRVAAHRTERMSGRTVAVVVALTAGVAFTLAPAHHAAPRPKRPAGRPGALPATTPPVALPATLGNLAPVAQVRDLLGRLTGGDGSDRMRLPFTETWEHGLGAWHVTGASATPECGVLSGCELRLDPADSVAVSRDVGLALPASTMVTIALRGTAGETVRSAVDLAVGSTTVTITTELKDSGGSAVVSSPATRATARLALLPQPAAGLYVVLNASSAQVVVGELVGTSGLTTVGLALPEPPRRLEALTFRATRDAGAANRVRLGAVAFRATPACSDGRDNDGDGRIDAYDGGCTDLLDDAESPEPQCDDGIDNDGDGRTDYPADPSCQFGRGGSETTTCSDGIDNDGDDLADYPADPKCLTAYDESELAACRDGVDNEKDSTTDYPADPGCTSPDDDTEWTCLTGKLNLNGLDPTALWHRPFGAGLCLDPVERVATFGLVRQADGRIVRGYVDDYRMALPGGGAQDLLCVTLTGGATTTAPCAALGGTFVGHVAALVRLDAEPNAEVDATAHVDVCRAALMVLVRTELQNPADRDQVVLSPC
jgi:RNA polymerase sigma factor (sigma-70 family)